MSAVNDYARKLCLDENARWPDPVDKCLLPPGSCPWCQRKARKAVGGDLVEQVARIIEPTAFAVDASSYGIDDSTDAGKAEFKRTVAYGARMVAMERASKVIVLIRNEFLK